MENLIETVRQVRQQFGALMSDDECARLCNEVAWRHRASGWGVSGKKTGTRGRLPNGTEIAHDILHHRPSQEIVDILIGAGAASTPTWHPLGPQGSADRPWVAPVDPATFASPAPNIPPPSVPTGPTTPAIPPQAVPSGPMPAEVMQILELIQMRVDLLAHDSTGTAEGVQRLEAALANGIPVTLRHRVLGELKGIVGGR